MGSELISNYGVLGVFILLLAQIILQLIKDKRNGAPNLEIYLVKLTTLQEGFKSNLDLISKQVTELHQCHLSMSAIDKDNNYKWYRDNHLSEIVNRLEHIIEGIEK